MIVVRRMQRARARGLYCALCRLPLGSWLGVKVITCLADTNKSQGLVPAPAQRPEMIAANLEAEAQPSRSLANGYALVASLPGIRFPRYRYDAKWLGHPDAA
jgi:hypothetical protein